MQGHSMPIRLDMASPKAVSSAVLFEHTLRFEDDTSAEVAAKFSRASAPRKKAELRSTSHWALGGARRLRLTPHLNGPEETEGLPPAMCGPQMLSPGLGAVSRNPT